jgi:hypothetical protein
LFPIILSLLPKVGPVIAALPEFQSLIEQVKSTLSGNDQATLQKAYELARQHSDDAHTDLQNLVAEHTQG